MKINAFSSDPHILARRGASDCDRIFYVGHGRMTDDRILHFVPFGAERLSGDGVYLPSVFSSDEAIDEAIELVLRGAPVIASCCLTLDEVGTCDKKFGVTPIGLAHKYGLLGENTYIAGAVYLDKDDIDLIVQSGAKVVLTPSDSMGNGCGIPPLRMLCTLGAEVYLGTGSGEYDEDADMDFEERLLRLSVSGALCTKDPVPDDLIRGLR